MMHGEKFINPRYRVYYYDQETGLYYLQTRYYDPKVRRFLSADDASVLTKDPERLTEKNLYAYCDDNPVMYQDDAGMFVITATAIEIAVGAIINIATSYILCKSNRTEVWNRRLWGYCGNSRSKCYYSKVLLRWLQVHFYRYGNYCFELYGGRWIKNSNQ